MVWQVIDQLEQDAADADDFHWFEENLVTAGTATTPEVSLTGTKADESPPCIRFQGVDVVSPAGDAFASHLSFKVGEAEGLMVTGRSATGKSSLVRVLSGLWPAHTGNVTLPGCRTGMQPSLSDVFIVPQRIHMVLGTLADQITYPARIGTIDRTAADEARMLSLLEKVGVDYLVARWGDDGDLNNLRDADASVELGLAASADMRGPVTVASEGWDKEVEWEHILSLGEQQRLGLARMYWHRPKFAVSVHLHSFSLSPCLPPSRTLSVFTTPHARNRSWTNAPRQSPSMSRRRFTPRQQSKASRPSRSVSATHYLSGTRSTLSSARTPRQVGL